jgi:hypothetical protein
MPPEQVKQKSALGTALSKKIAQLKKVTSGERDMYPYIRDMLTAPDFGIGLRVDQIVVDSAFAGTKNAPDLTVYSTKNGKPLKTPDHALAIFEVKRGSALATSVDELFQEKKKYIQPGTRLFFFLDQERVMKQDLLTPSGWQDKTWEALSDPEIFKGFFSAIAYERLRLEEQLQDFRNNKTPYAYQSVAEIGRKFFVETIRDVAELLSDAVRRLIDSKVLTDLQEANKLIDNMAKTWGTPEFDWNSADAPIEFQRITDEKQASALTAAQIAEYQEEHDLFSVALDPLLYAVRIENSLLQDYALRMGIETEPSLLKPLRTKNKLTDSGKAVESFVYETASLILSRMLMVRFSEDNGFLKRYISNGGIEIFSKYADYYAKPMQALLLETYRQSRDLYRSLFDQNVLDWALDSTDEQLSDALLHSMFLLSRWDFRTVHGDILSGVYDRYLDVSKRRALGEVFTRPEIARYMLDRCGYEPTKTVLDPACGTGTFLVEALSRDVKRFRTAGMLNEQTIVPTLRRLHGLDISPFSVALAQIQILWHIIDIFASKTPTEIRKIAGTVVPSISVHGGHSSLDPLGKPLASGLHSPGSQGGFDLSTISSVERRKRFAVVSRKFRQISQGNYDIVVGNPPYVRSHRLVMDAETSEAYSEVVRGPGDLYIPFFYRTLAGWLKQGGKMGLVAPIPIVESGYAGRLRAIFDQYKILEIVDLEALRKKTFRGVKRPTVILIAEKSAPSLEDDVVLTTLFMDCYQSSTDTIDFSKARRETVKRLELKQTHYLPAKENLKFWAIDSFGNTNESPLTTKIVAKDVSILRQLRDCPRLGDIVQIAYAKRGKQGKKDVALSVPANQSPSEWEPYLMIAPGIQLGGAKAFAKTGWPIFKGQNIFPAGILGERMGYWDPETSITDQERILGYRSLFDSTRLFAIRNISQLPTACRVPANTGFQNTAHLVQLNEEFPLHLYLLSRIPQWYCAKLLRSNIIEDLATTWSKKQLTMIPIPATRNEEVIKNITACGSEILRTDKDVLNADRHVEALIKAAPSKTISALFAAGSEPTAGLDVKCLQEGSIALAGIREDGEHIRGTNPLLDVLAPHCGLRTYLIWMFEKMIEEDSESSISISEFGQIAVPDNLSEVVLEIRKVKDSNPMASFQAAIDQLDLVVAEAIGFSSSQLSYVRSAMTEDPFLNQLRPMYEHRGLRVQLYSDHSDSDRYN